MRIDFPRFTYDLSTKDIIDKLNNTFGLLTHAFNSGKLDGNNVSQDYVEGVIFATEIIAQGVVADWIYAGKINADQIDVVQGKIMSAQIESLSVGDNVAMGENATISWSQVTNQPTIPDPVVLPSYIKSTYIDSTTVQSPTIVGGTITGGIFRTAVGYPRIEIDSGGIVSYGALSLAHGVAIRGSSDYGSIEFNWNGSLRAHIGLNSVGQFFIDLPSSTYVYGTLDCSWAHFDGLKNSSGDNYVTDDWVEDQGYITSLSGYATQNWVSNNFASDTHNHGNDYVHSRVGDNISIALGTSGIVIRQGDTVLGSIFYD